MGQQSVGKQAKFHASIRGRLGLVCWSQVVLGINLFGGEMLMGFLGSFEAQNLEVVPHRDLQ